MPQTSATTISDILGTGLSDDGKFFVLQMLDRHGRNINIAIPIEKTLALAHQAASAHALSWKRSGKDRLAAETSELTGFRVGADVPDTGKTILILESAQSELSYWLSRDVAEALLAELSFRVGQPTPLSNRPN